MPAFVFEQENQNAEFEPEYGVPREQRAVSPQVRAFPNEDVYFWVKPVDNSKVSRQGDPKIWETCWRFFSAMSLAVIVAVGLLLPNAINLLSGIQLQQLRVENSELRDEERRLALDESRLLSPERMEQMAADLRMKDAGPGTVVHLRGHDGEAVAMNKKKGFPE